MKQVSYTLAEIAQRIDASIIGDASISVTGLASLQCAKSHHLAFLSNTRYKAQLLTTQAGAVLLKHTDITDHKGNALVVKDPYAAYAVLSHLFDQTPKPTAGIHPTAVIAESACIHESASIGAFVVIEDGVEIAAHVVIESHSYIAENVKIGLSSWLDKHVVVQHHCVIGERVRVHANTVIGGDGFGFAPHQGSWYRIAQLGAVIIANDVRIGANCTIDRGALDDTVIGQGVIIDNLVQIAHNVIIGDYSALAAAVAIAGSTKIGKHCIIGGASGIAGHLDICDHVQLTGMSMVTKSIHKAGTYSSGTGISDNMQWKKMIVGLRQLAETPVSKISRKIDNLQAQIERVESAILPKLD